MLCVVYHRCDAIFQHSSLCVYEIHSDRHGSVNRQPNQQYSQVPHLEADHLECYTHLSCTVT